MHWTINANYHSQLHNSILNKVIQTGYVNVALTSWLSSPLPKSPITHESPQGLRFDFQYEKSALARANSH